MKKTDRGVLLVTAMVGAEELGKLLSQSLQLPIQIAKTSRAAAAVLRREEFIIVLVDSAMPESQEKEQLWQRVGLAIPLELPLGSIGANSLSRQLRSTLARWEHETQMARRAAAYAIEDEMRQHVTGLLLQSDLVLMQPEGMPPAILQQVTVLRSLAHGLRTRLMNA